MEWKSLGMMKFPIYGKINMFQTTSQTRFGVFLFQFDGTMVRKRDFLAILMKRSMEFLGYTALFSDNPTVWMVQQGGQMWLMFAVHCGPIGFNMSFLASNKAWNLPISLPQGRLRQTPGQISVGAVHPKFGRFKSPCPKNKPYMWISFAVLVMFGYRFFHMF